MMRYVHRFALCAAFGSLGVFVGGVSVAELIPGPGKTGCYAEFDVAGATTTDKHQTCTDGDPTCDTDGQCQGTCTFFIQLCVNQTNVTGCTPSAFKKRGVHVKGHLLPVPVTTGTEAACGDGMPITVPVHGKTGRRKLEVRANTTGSPPREKFFLFLTCKRRTDACPAPGSTTTTTVSTTTTTTH
jgi:hypothetical protein